jgi:hypothetical protein
LNLRRDALRLIPDLLWQVSQRDVALERRGVVAVSVSTDGGTIGVVGSAVDSTMRKPAMRKSTRPIPGMKA